MEGKFKYGIFFWMGGGVYSGINMIMNFINAPRSKILFYNYLITTVAAACVILNIFLMIKAGKKKADWYR